VASAQIVLWSAQHMSVQQIAEIAFTWQDRVREVIHNFNADGFAIADGTVEPGPDDLTVAICMDEFGPLNLPPHPGRQWAPVAAGPRRR
jgi:hypothetical protein